MKKIRFKDLINKVMLVGLTYYSNTGVFIEQKQIYGTVIQSDKQGIKIKQSNGEIFELPPDLSSVTVAAPGVYTLHSTKEIVKNPDFLSTWNVTKPE